MFECFRSVHPRFRSHGTYVEDDASFEMPVIYQGEECFLGTFSGESPAVLLHRRSNTRHGSERSAPPVSVPIIFRDLASGEHILQETGSRDPRNSKETCSAHCSPVASCEPGAFNPIQIRNVEIFWRWIAASNPSGSAVRRQPPIQRFVGLTLPGFTVNDQILPQIHSKNQIHRKSQPLLG